MSDAPQLPQRILAIDLGERRIGLAISDPMGNFAVGLETLTVTPRMDVLAALEQVCQSYQVGQVVLGLPRNMDGGEGPQARMVRGFGEDLAARLQKPVLYYDERLTSVLAQKTLQAQGIKASRNKGLIDQASAKRILQDFLDRQGYQREAAARDGGPDAS